MSGKRLKNKIEQLQFNDKLVGLTNELANERSGLATNSFIYNSYNPVRMLGTQQRALYKEGIVNKIIRLKTNPALSNTMQFQSTKTKTAISVRDGIQEYLGVEIEKEPADKVFKIYRSPATIGNAASKMAGIPLTNEHVDFNISNKVAIGKVESCALENFFDSNINSTLCVKNKIAVDNNVLEMLATEKKNYH